MGLELGIILGISCLIFHRAPIPPPSGKGSNTAIFGLTTFLFPASPCKVVRNGKKKKTCFNPKNAQDFEKVIAEDVRDR